MKRAFLFFFVIGLAVLAASCSIDDDQTNFKYTTLKTVNASLPDTFELGRVYKVDVNLLRPDDCTYSETFDVRRSFTDSTNIRTVAAIGIVLDEGPCEAVNDSIQDSFQFEVIYSNPYVFQFYTGDDENGEPEFLEIEVPVKHRR
ncbi:hypothetical protein RQM65_09780 [Pricia sp. S334]|uniref:Lipoprotein n=1 Tax=Pricia mediterranea TaxID=3076079 RepID=A0ABU3L5E4_9FLAO|nr:hypothetical protein [Pricia sp. S334]MDT7828950.1 hypothetical protein [Pricia sp. S334]